jgi:hypothetical protein
LFSLIMFGSMFGLVRRPGAFLAVLMALIGFSMFFNLVYGGAYRHEALWLVFLISMYWITGSKARPREPGLPARLTPLIRPVSTIGSMLFLLLVALQVPEGIYKATNAATNDPPFSRSRDVHFTRKVQLRLSLDDILADARSLRLKTGKPVMILLGRRLDPSLPVQVYRDGFGWELVTTPEQVRTFQASTRFIKRFAPALTNESFGVYLFD